MRTQIKIPVVYTGTAGRSKTPRTIVSAVDHPVEIREVHEDDAPLALRAVPRDVIFNRVDYRLYNGRLYRWAYRAKSDGPHQVANQIKKMQADIWAGMADHVKGLPGTTIPPKARFIPFPKGSSFEDVGAMLVAETGNIFPVDTAEADVADWCRKADDVVEKYIIVNGRCYELSTEPLYRVDMRDPKRVDWANPFQESPYAEILRRYRHDKIGPTGHRDRNQNCAYFNADQKEEAEAFFASRRVTTGEPEDFITIERWIEEFQCIDTHALEFDRAARLLLNDVSWGISLRSRNRPVLLEDDTAELVRAVMRLQLMVTAQNPTEGIDSELEFAMQDVVDTAVGGTRSRPVLSPHVRDFVAYAIDRWQDRPIISPEYQPAVITI